jgi:hypothetical protein
VKPFTWSVTGGALPKGLTLNPLTGLISGVPAAQETRTVTITVKDSSVSAYTGKPQYDTQNYIFAISPPGGVVPSLPRADDGEGGY